MTYEHFQVELLEVDCIYESNNACSMNGEIARKINSVAKKHFKYVKMNNKC